MPISETWISPYPGFEKPDYVKRSTLRETGILLHRVHLIPVSDCCRRPAQVQRQPRDVTERQTMAAMRASRIWSDKDIGVFVFSVMKELNISTASLSCVVAVTP